MKTKGEITSQMERLRLRAIRKNQRAGRVLKRMERKLQKRRPDLAKVIAQQKKSEGYMSQSFKYLERRQHLLQQRNTEPLLESDQSEIQFNLEKVSERFIKKFGVNSCVYRAHMESPVEGKTLRVKDILTELNKLFTVVIDTVKEQCDLKTTLED